MIEPLDLIVESICRLPIDFVQFGSYSAVELVRRSGYKRERAPAMVDRIRACLAKHPDWVEAWFGWSSDTRSSPAWFVRTCGANEFEVGHYDNGYAKQRRFDDRTQACAEYVHLVIEDMVRLV